MELPLTHPEYYEEMGIKPPKGVRLIKHNLNQVIMAFAGDPVRPPWHWQNLAGEGRRQPDQRDLPQSGRFRAMIESSIFSIYCL